MEFKEINRSIKIPVLGIGTGGVGGWMTKDTSADKEFIDALKTAINLGMTHIDTAEVYGAGHSEEIAGLAIKGMNRRRLFITTKVWKTHLRYKDVIRAAKGSLKRLGVKYIDLYLIHWPNPKVPLKETMKAMDFLVKKKIVRFIGVSNFSLKLLKEAQSYTKNKIVANEVEYNLLIRGPEKALLEYCQKNNIYLIAYQPVAGGKLARPGFKVLDDLSKKYKKTQAQIAINWLISKKNIITIPKASKIPHIKENLGASGWRLSNEDSEKLDEYFQRLWFFNILFGKYLWMAKRFAYANLSPCQREKLGPLYDSVINFIGRLKKMFI